MVEQQVLRKSDDSGSSEASSSLAAKEYSKNSNVFACREDKKSHFRPKKKKENSKFVGNCYEYGKIGHKSYEYPNEGKESVNFVW